MKGKVMMLALVLFAEGVAAQPTAKPEIDEPTRADVIERVQEGIRKYYVYPEKGEAIADELRKRHQAGAYNEITNPNELADRLTRDSREVWQDKHLRVEYNPKLERDILQFTSGREGAGKVRAEEIAKEKKHNFFFHKVEILAGNIGYIEFSQFVKPSPGARTAIAAAMQFVANTDALVFDVRNNRGGDGDTATSMLGYFFKSKTTLGRSFNRLENKWTDQHVVNKADFTKGLVLNMPICVLTSDRTFSAAEWFAYSLQTLRGAVIVGEPSKGSAHLTRSFSMGHGFVGFIPHTRFENAKTGTDWEGKGVLPDIAVDEDDSLIAAQIHILEKQREAVSDPTEQRRLTWIINSHRAKRSGITIDPTETARYLGRFAEFEVAVTDGRLTFTDTNQPKRTPLPLIPISSTLFQAGGDYQVEFLGENDGSSPAIKVYWEDGWAEEIPRTKP